jgi:Uma2 family endonuclease
MWQWRGNWGRIRFMGDMALEMRLREFTVSEFHRMADAGIIADRERVELLDGRIVEMAPIGIPHWDRHASIVAYLNRTLAGRAKIVGQGSFPLGSRNEPQPDIAVLAPRSYGRDQSPPAMMEVFAFIELAESSLAKDLGPKLALYARFGIADYIVVDLDGKRLLHHSLPHELGYRSVKTLAEDDAFTLSALPDIRLSATPFLSDDD